MLFVLIDTNIFAQVQIVTFSQAFPFLVTFGICFDVVVVVVFFLHTRIQRESERDLTNITVIVTSCYGNRDKLQRSEKKASVEAI